MYIYIFRHASHCTMTDSVQNKKTLSSLLVSLLCEKIKAFVKLLGCEPSLFKTFV